MPGATFEPFETVIVPFPFTERALTKRRPALVVSSGAFNHAHDHHVLAMITSTERDPWSSDVVLQHWEQAGLRVACRVRLKLFSLPVALIASRLGGLSAADGRRVAAQLTAALAVPPPQPRHS